jgi:hypothetical protein
VCVDRRPQRLQTKMGAHRLASRVLFVALGHQRGVIRCRCVALRRTHISVCVPWLRSRLHHTISALHTPTKCFDFFHNYAIHTIAIEG